VKKLGLFHSILCFLLLWGLALPTGGVIAANADLTPHKLTGQLKVGVKSVLNERTPAGTRVAAVVRLYNGGSGVAAIPEYQVRVSSSEGTLYTLEPSAANPRAVQPRETVELSYMVTVQRSDAFSLMNLSWVSVDEFVYPKKETVVLSVSVRDLEWRGNGVTALKSESVFSWGQSFTLPVGSASIQYTPVQIMKQSTTEGLSTVVRLLAENKGASTEWIPEFTLTGKAGKRHYTAVRAEAGELSVAPGEQRYIHYLLPGDVPDPFSTLTVVTPESFKTANGDELRYTIGRVQVNVPPSISSVQPKSYKLGDAITLTEGSSLAEAGVELKLVEVQRFEQAGNGYQTAVAKFVVRNTGSRSIAFPSFGAEWETSNGDRYMGVRQNTGWSTLLPKIGYVVSYAFTVPASESGKNAIVHVLDGGSGFQQEIASVTTSLPASASGSAAAMYPFTLHLKDWSIDSRSEGTTDFVYTYALSLDVSIDRVSDNVVDGKSTRLRAELVDSDSGRVLSSQAIALTGAGRLLNGSQLIAFDAKTEQRISTLAVNLYEVFDTSEGAVERLVKVLK